jgi:cation diffusion facilitator CzcD-associated flavoprotein CzcO
MLGQMREKLHDEFLESKLIPDWAVGCRRLTPGVNYLETLGAENVRVVYGEIDSISEKGCICDDGIEYPIDVLICATGFDTSFKPRFPLIGPAGTDLRDEWKDEAKGYLGVAVPGFPNYLVFLGPNCPIGNGPVLSAIGMSICFTKCGDIRTNANNRMSSRLHAEVDKPLANRKHSQLRTED